jgi:hypothetical protein
VIFYCSVQHCFSFWLCFASFLRERESMRNHVLLVVVTSAKLLLLLDHEGILKKTAQMLVRQHHNNTQGASAVPAVFESG